MDRRLTHNDAGEDVAPRSPEDGRWNEWVSPTRLRGHLLGNTLGDWLNLYGEQHGFQEDPALDDRLHLLRFLRKRGLVFEEEVARYLAQRAELSRITDGSADGHKVEYARATLAALEAGREIIHGGVLWNPESRTYGIPDFLVRADVFDRLFPDHPPPYDELGAEHADGGWRYVVVDAKFTTLKLFSEKPRKGSIPGDVNNSASFPAYKAQLFLYNEALGRLQGKAPHRAFLLGRGWKQGTKGRGVNAMERLGPVSMTPELAGCAQEALDWVRRLRTEGSNWRVLPEPTVPELRPPASGDADWPWKGAIREITEQLEDPIRLWQVRATNRDKAGKDGITSWRDPRATAASLGVSDTYVPTLDAILDVNRSEGPVVRPGRVTAAEGVWRERPGLEFFVDFETVDALNDDFSTFPEKGGQPLIFMIGCGHIENGAWRFSCFVADRLTTAAEEEAIDAWISHMGSVRRRLGVSDTPKALHWANAEVSAFKAACKRRQGDRGEISGDFKWFNLLDRVVKAEPVVVRGAFGFGLKEIAKTLHGHGLIETSWEDSEVDGQGAMVGAVHCDREAAEKGIRLADTELMQEIRRYNEVDCRVMQEILEYLRANH